MFKISSVIVSKEGSKSIISSKSERSNDVGFLFRLNKEAEALNFGKEYLDCVPFDSEMILKISQYLRTLKEYENAIELSERLRLRRKQNLNNLINLAQCYIALNHYDRAKLLLNDVLLIDKNNLVASEILDQITE